MIPPSWVGKEMCSWATATPVSIKEATIARKRCMRHQSGGGLPGLLEDDAANQSNSSCLGLTISRKAESRYYHDSLFRLFTKTRVIRWAS